MEFITNILSLCTGEVGTGGTPKADAVTPTETTRPLSG